MNKLEIHKRDTFVVLGTKNYNLSSIDKLENYRLFKTKKELYLKSVCAR